MDTQFAGTGNSLGRSRFSCAALAWLVLVMALWLINSFSRKADIVLDSRCHSSLVARDGTLLMNLEIKKVDIAKSCNAFWSSRKSVVVREVSRYNYPYFALRVIRFDKLGERSPYDGRADICGVGKVGLAPMPIDWLSYRKQRSVLGLFSPFDRHFKDGHCSVSRQMSVIQDIDKSGLADGVNVDSHRSQRSTFRNDEGIAGGTRTHLINLFGAVFCET